MRKNIYLAGAMEVYKNSDKSKKWREKVKEYFHTYSTDFQCINPMDYYSFSNDISKNNAEIMRFDLRKIRESDIILVNLKEIRNSIGTSDEILYSYILGKPIIGFLEESVDENELIKKIHPWKYTQIDRVETGKNSMLDACEYIRNYYG